MGSVKRRQGDKETRRQGKKEFSSPCPLVPLSPLPLFPIPHSVLTLFVLFAIYASAAAQDRPAPRPPTGPETPPASSKPARSPDRSCRPNLSPLSDPDPEAGPKSGTAPMTPGQSRSEVKKLWGEAEDLRATGAIDSLRAAMSKYEESLRLLHSAGKAAEPGEIAYTLNQLAATSDSPGDRRQPIPYHKQSRPPRLP